MMSSLKSPRSQSVCARKCWTQRSARNAGRKFAPARNQPPESFILPRLLCRLIHVLFSKQVGVPLRHAEAGGHDGSDAPLRAKMARIPPMSECPIAGRTIPTTGQNDAVARLQYLPN